ncbi:MAG: hypothetical protein AMXMBFR84_07630 [Candidatus Hydrogenedentota bacterium]
MKGRILKPPGLHPGEDCRIKVPVFTGERKRHLSGRAAVNLYVSGKKLLNITQLGYKQGMLRLRTGL